MPQRNPESIPLDGVERLRLDVTDPKAVAAAAREYGDVNLLINNAGIARWTGFLEPNSVEAARAEMETNYFGPLFLSRAFAPVLAKNGGGAIINVLSILSWIAVPSAGTYSASKAAAWALPSTTTVDPVTKSEARDAETQLRRRIRLDDPNDRPGSVRRPPGAQAWPSQHRSGRFQ
ncbi:SDR family NAD(P)-dependent oxidoreductase [Edaphobacter bradus]|uniref:SDR family NAD(P)-dependent oxidoreductase n=1 Tax=Edaphobacter bradus TaxID=2259016 RepID=UPI0021DF7712|nr:SDR family NAD(P)-dependent oxidoreductase [Edaphobacter bradus]